MRDDELGAAMLVDVCAQMRANRRTRCGISTLAAAHRQFTLAKVVWSVCTPRVYNVAIVREHGSPRGEGFYLRLTWKCEVGAQLGLKRLIWGYVLFFKGFNRGSFFFSTAQLTEHPD